MQVFETPGSVSLQIKLPSGRVVVTTADEPRTTVEVVALGRRGQDAIDEIDVTMDEHHGRHVVRIEQKDKFRWGPIQITWGGDFECRITCPPGTDLDLAGGSTDLRAEGELGEVSARSASGDVRLGSARGAVQVKTASGDISVGAVRADSSLVTVSGDLGVERVEASVAARSVSGDVTIGSVIGELGLSTTSGDVELRSVEDGDVRVQTVSGDVRIGIARGTRVWVDAASVSGKLESELGLENQQSHEPEGSVVPLHVKTVSGDVSLVRSGAPLPA
jgi:Putative adhesin